MNLFRSQSVLSEAFFSDNLFLPLSGQPPLPPALHPPIRLLYGP